MNKNCRSRLEVLRASLEMCKGHSFTERKGFSTWRLIADRIKVLAKANAEESKRLESFGSEIAENLDQPKKIAKVLDGEWLELLSKVLNTVVSAETKRERLNCATCDPVDFPLLIVVIQSVAYGAPGRIWVPGNNDWYVPFIGLPGSYGPPQPPSLYPPKSHYEIAARTWYRPQLAMLATSIWPMNLGLEYYESTLHHILNPEVAASVQMRDMLEGQTPGYDEIGGLK